MDEARAPQASTAVRRRHAFFLHGLDPRGPNHYYALYRDQAALQGRVTGQRLTVGAAERAERLVTRWSVDDADGVHTTIDALRWDDVIRREWRRGGVGMLLRFLLVYAHLLIAGHVRTIYRLSDAYCFTMTYPAAAAIVLLAAPVALGGLAAWSAALAGAPAWLSAAGATAVAVAAVAGLRRAVALIKADWIMQITIFTVEHGRGRIDGMEERIDLFAARIAAALADPEVDEVLVAGHSAGASLAVSAAARAMAANGSAALPKLSVLTMGQMIPTIGLNRPAHRFRSELAALAGRDDIAWVDVSALPDGACFPLSDPVAACGLPATGRPRLVSARFHRQFPPERYRVVLNTPFRIHFQYLMAAELPEGFDYFRATAGRQRLADLMAGAAPG